MAERFYYTDSFLKSFGGTVASVREVAVPGGEPIWQIALDRTAFYPTSGGQPFDTGMLTPASRAGTSVGTRVEQVEEDEAGEVWHYVSKPLAAGMRVEGQIDWERRFDHMQQHTGQHLLSAAFLHELRMPTVSFHLGQSVSTIDLAGTSLAHHSLERVERIANEIIGEDRPVIMRTLGREDAEALLAAGELRKLPDRQGTIRVIEIEGYDHNACGGTHVRSTGQIGGLLVRSIEKVSRGVRVEFACGLRAVRAARADAAVLSETAGILSTAAADVPDCVRKLLAENKAASKEREKLRAELASLEAARVAMDAAVENGLRLIVRGWKERDRDYVRMLASRTVAAAPCTAVIYTAADSTATRVFVARSADLVFDCGRILREALAQMGLRGGGSADLAQGDVPADQAPALAASIALAIRGAVAEGHSTSAAGGGK